MSRRFTFASESVSEGHPDKMADQVSDAILDACLEADPGSRVACECLMTANEVIVAGEVHTTADIMNRVTALVRGVIRDTGHNSDSGYEAKSVRVRNLLHAQSEEIRYGVDQGGAGDQGLMFGYACRETPELMPYPIQLAHRIMERLAAIRHSGKVPWILPDAKCQVTAIYEDDRVTGIDNIILSTQHAPYTNHGSGFWSVGSHPHGHHAGLRGVSHKMIADVVIPEVIIPEIAPRFDPKEIRFHINPSGSFTQGGPATDTGLTGRKIIVDTYGGSCPHGGGAFSGKDASKVDRSGAYMARYLAKNIVASQLADRCMVQLAYSIGMKKPVSMMLDFMGTGQIPEGQAEDYIQKNLDLRPEAIIGRLRLQRPIFRKTATYGHFGRELQDFTWENTDLAGEFGKI